MGNLVRFLASVGLARPGAKGKKSGQRCSASKPVLFAASARQREAGQVGLLCRVDGVGVGVCLARSLRGLDAVLLPHPGKHTPTPE